LHFARVRIGCAARADFNSVLALPPNDKWAVDTAREGLGFVK
jgi:hypothetical protein